nr:NYN domain-containing protein [Rhizobium laguerreae]
MGDSSNMSTDTLALLIDGDNASPKIVSGLLAEIANYGTASVKRIYGDWTKPNLNGWKECLLEHSIQPVQQFVYTTGKNATDGAMIIMPWTYSIRGASRVSASSPATAISRDWQYVSASRA